VYAPLLLTEPMHRLAAISAPKADGRLENRVQTLLTYV